MVVNIRICGLMHSKVSINRCRFQSQPKKAISAIAFTVSSPSVTMAMILLQNLPLRTGLTNFLYVGYRFLVSFTLMPILLIATTITGMFSSIKAIEGPCFILSAARVTFSMDIGNLFKFATKAPSKATSAN